MEKRELQRLLNQPYNKENWKRIVQFVFPNVSVLAKPNEFPIPNDKIKRFSQIGNVRLNDGKNLALFELVLADNVNIQRNRVELNNEISKYIDQEQIHGVLSVFEQGGDDYRFTFSAKSTEFDTEESDFVQRRTDTKRYTYVLGKNESCKTPADRFYSLSEKKEIVNIHNVQEAFSVESLSKEFFDQYKRYFEKFWRYIAENQIYNKAFFADDTEKKDIKIRDFTKQLLGRIVFLHFLQKKGWLGCPNEKKWGNGDKQFIFNLFNEYNNKDKFHSECLHQLFYHNLNSRRVNDILDLSNCPLRFKSTKVPYVNGGLFDSDLSESEKIDFPKEYFSDLLSFFNQYNFTINENDPNDHEVGIDPEMLGHIFENLLEDNKDKGAYYTPKTIVNYMCQESIIEYLKTKIDIHRETKVANSIIDLIKYNDIQSVSDNDLIEQISKALFEVKICDPAIGSGAFPMGILNVIYGIIESLYYVQPDTVARIWSIDGDQWNPYSVKRNIIQNSIYGVDIESGAIDIARLRFWLSLVVEEEVPTPLPNLDYKIMQGNSLLESFENIDLSKISDADAYQLEYETDQIDIFTGEAKSSTKVSLDFESIDNLMREYFLSENSNEKKRIHDKIDFQVLNHIKYTISIEREKKERQVKILNDKIKLNELAVSNWGQKENIRNNSKEAKKLLKVKSELNRYYDQEERLSKISNSDDRPFFLWHLYFNEVFSIGGFDIVIGNPPYKDYREVPVDIRQSDDFPLAIKSNRPNFYQYFIELSFNKLLNNEGVLCFINPNQFLSTDNGFALREYILENATIRSITDVSYIKVFKEASTYPIIYVIKNDQTSNNDIRINRCQNLNLLDDTTFELNQVSLSQADSKIIPLNKEYLLLSEIEKGLDRLSDIATLKWGTSASGYGKLKIKSDEYNNCDNKSDYQPILQTSDTKKYYVDWKGEYIPINIYSDRIIEEFKKPKILIGRVTREIQACIDYEKRFVGKTTLITDVQIPLLVLLALLNSDFINRWYYLKFETTHMAGGYLRFDVPYLKQIPIPTINNEVVNELEDLVSKLISHRDGGHTDDTHYEKRINQIVYQLFDLDAEQIEILGLNNP